MPMIQNPRLPALVLGLAVAGFTAACGLPAALANTQSAATQPVRCEIRLEESRGATTISGVVDTTRAVTGTYSLAISSRGAAGSTSIRQSGDFAARPGSPALLGETTLAGARQNFRAEIELNVEGRRLTCNEATL